jgi:hypothetical protein
MPPIEFWLLAPCATNPAGPKDTALEVELDLDIRRFDCEVCEPGTGTKNELTRLQFDLRLKGQPGS